MERKTIRGVGSIYKQPRSDNWFIQFAHRGKPIRRTAHTPDEKKATKFLLEQFAKAKAGGVSYIQTREERLTFDEMASAIESDYRVNNQHMKALRVRLLHLRPAFGDLRAIEVTTRLIVRYRRDRLAEGAAKASVNHEVSILKRMFNLAVENGELSRANVPAFPQQFDLSDGIREGFIDQATFLAIRSRLPERLKDPITFMSLVPWRPREVLGMLWSSIDIENRVLLLPRRSSKNREPRRLPLVGELWEIIERALARRRPDCPNVFYHFKIRNGEGTEPRPVASYNTAWIKACAEVGLVGGVKGILPYDLRRTGVRNLKRAGVSDTVAMEISGHKTRSMLDRYNVTADDDLVDAMDRLAKYMEKQAKRSKVTPINRARDYDQTMIEQGAVPSSKQQKR